jgi:excisionase family DNA binding protein
MQSKLLRTSEVADLLLVSNRTIQRWADKKLIKAITLPSGHRRFEEQTIKEMKRPGFQDSGNYMQKMEELKLNWCHTMQGITL